MDDHLRVAVIGSQTRNPGTSRAYTVYRTSVNYNGLCYHRLIRFRHFFHFSKNLKLAPEAPPIDVKMPHKIWWSRKASMQPETIEARQVMLNEYIQQVCARPLTPRSRERLLKLLQLEDYAPKEEEDRVIDSRLGSRRSNTSFTEPASEIGGLYSIQSSIEEQESKEDLLALQSGKKERQPQDSLTDEKENATTEQIGLDTTVQRQNSDASSDPAKDSSPRVRAPSAPPLLSRQVTTRPFSMSLNSQNMKRVMFDPSLDSDRLFLKKEDRDSIGSALEYVSTPEHHYVGQIKQCIASIEEIVDSSRYFAAQMREKQEANRLTSVAK
ncbi:hypothetical protein CCR75_005014 [Bremia lactucae]|uniref:PX domain-containing protein n=1 Tax=Bremia lactucae TaxID=4779 RepID=A0A976FMM7_BRELC|nr:hypothetical protein CCR75_005016 [Bremia lactucae]TDH69296.1 hypothetical protein CCR75_005014 [Bremia lactucae]